LIIGAYFRINAFTEDKNNNLKIHIRFLLNYGIKI